MDLGLGGKVALVTGASLGIGRAIARELAVEGATVVLNARNAGPLREAAESTGADPDRIAIAVGDMSSADDIRRVVAEANRRYGRIDILVNNAGSSPSGTLATVSDETWHRALELKLLGYVRCAREVLPGMRARRWGRIVNIIGGGGYMPRATYLLGSINAALLNVTKALAEDGAPDNVLVNGVNPGATRTARWATMVEQRTKLEGRTREDIEARAASSIPLGRIGEPEDVAGLVAFLCSQRASYITGGLFDVDGGSRRAL